MSNKPNPQQNQLLAAFPKAEYERLLPHLELVQLPLGKVLYEAGGHLDHAYFPTTAVVALLYELENGASAQIAVVGRDGILGIALFMGGDTRPNLAVVQNDGDAYRLKAQLFQQEFGRFPALRPPLLRYTLALTNQMARTAV
jgi:CRP-like cAMP-binding protein